MATIPPPSIAYRPLGKYDGVPIHFLRHFVSRIRGWPMCEWFFVPDPMLAAVVALCQTTNTKSPTCCAHGSTATAVVDRWHEYDHHPSARYDGVPMHFPRHFVSRIGGRSMCGWFYVPDPMLAVVVALCRMADPKSPTY